MSASAASAVAENSDTVLVPLAASSGHKRGTWKPVNLSQEHLIMSGGFHAKFEVIPVIRYQSGTTTHSFVELNKNAQWFLKGVGGLQTGKGDLKAVRVLQAVGKQFSLACAGPDGVADAEAQDADSDEDPMDALDDVLIPTPKAKAKGQAKSKQRHALVQDLKMPRRPPCTGTDQNETIVISVYKKSASAKRGRSKYFLRSDFLDWLLSYAADELHFQGVVRAISPEAQVTNKANCTEVADVHLQWNFRVKAWDAEFVSGPFVGTTRCFHAVDLTTWRWARMIDLSFVEIDQSRTRGSAQKDVAKNFSTRWCRAIACGRADEFEKTWHLGDLVTSAKKRRGAGGEGTAVAEEPGTAVAEESATED